VPIEQLIGIGEAGRDKIKSNLEPLGEFSSRLLDMHRIDIEDEVDRISMDKFRYKLEISRESLL
jgi:hypothetical protein